MPRFRILATALSLAVLVAAITISAPSVGLMAGKDREVLPERVVANINAGDHPGAHQTADPKAPPRPTRGKGFQVERVFGPGGGVEDWEPAIAVDPVEGQYVYQAVTRFGGTAACPTCPDPAIIFRRSTDRGVTFGADQYICACPGTPDQDDPQIVVTNTGDVYIVWMESYVPGVSFAKSSDHGQTWTAPIHIDGGGTANWYSDKPWLIASPDGQDVYIAISAGECGSVCGEFYVVASHNYGASFGTRVKANTDSLYWYPEGGAVAPNGDVYFAASAEPASGATLQVVRSTNGGVSWTTQQLDTSADGPSCGGGGCLATFFAAQSSMDIDPAGNMVYAYVANAVNKANKTLYVRTSTNGTTWTPRIAISSVGDANFPQVVARDVGQFHIAWTDTSMGAGLHNVWVLSSGNAGATWGSKQRASNAGSGASYKTQSGFAYPYGDYFEMDISQRGLLYLIWGEGVSYTGAGGVWYTRSQRFRH